MMVPPCSGKLCLQDIISTENENVKIKNFINVQILLVFKMKMIVIKIKYVQLAKVYAKMIFVEINVKK